MWADMCRSGAGSRAANMSKISETQTEKGLHTKYPSAKLIFRGIGLTVEIDGAMIAKRYILLDRGCVL